MAVILLGALDETIVATALPHVVADLGGVSNYSVSFGVYLLFQTVTIPIYGKLGDAYGRRPLLLVAIVIFLVGSALCGMAQDMTQLAIFRSIQGAGAGGLIPLVQAAIGELVPPRDRGRYQGLTSAAFASAAILGPAVGGLIVDHASWRWIFYVNVPIGGIAFLLVAATMPPMQARVSRGFDASGAVLLSAATAAALVALLSLGSQRWDSTRVLGAALAATTLFGIFIRSERRARDPILPLAMLRSPLVRAASTCVFALSICMYGLILVVPLFAQGVLGMSGAASGTALTPFMIGAVVSSIGAGQAVSRTGRYRTCVLAGPLVMGSAMISLWRMDEATTTVAIAVGMFIAGVGIGLINPVLLAVAQNAVPDEMMGSTVAFLQFARTLGATSGATLFGLVVSHGLTNSAESDPLTGLSLPERSALADAIQPVFLLALTLCLTAFVAAVVGVKQRPLRRAFDDPQTTFADAR